MARKSRKSEDQSAIKWKKKSWYTIVAPDNFQSTALGESPAEEPGDLVGKMVSTNVMQLTKNMRKQHINMRFVVDNVVEGKAQTSPVSYVMSPSSVKRLVRSNRDRIDDSFVLKTNDGIFVRVKPIIVTKENMMGRQQCVMRAMAKEFFAQYAAAHTFEQFVQAVINDELTKELRSKVVSVGPVRTVEVRAFERIMKPTRKTVAYEPQGSLEAAAESVEETAEA